jgi:hypothetical protein
MKTKLKDRDGAIDSRTVDLVGRQKRKKERPGSALNTATVFVKQLRRLLQELRRSTKALSQLLISVLLMFQSCKEQQSSDRAILRGSGPISWVYPY